MREALNWTLNRESTDCEDSMLFSKLGTRFTRRVKILSVLMEVEFMRIFRQKVNNPKNKKS